MRRLSTLIAVTAMAMASCSGSSDSAADNPSPTTGTSAVSSSETPSTAVNGSPSSTAPSGGSTEGGSEGGSGTDRNGGEGNDPREIRAAASSLGQLVVDADGRTLYVYVDAGTTSCPSGCEAEWPPLVGAVTAGPGITATLGTRALGNGTEQVTIAGRPLYYYAGDTEPGASSGQGIGGTWFVVNGAGDPVTAP